MVLLEHLVKTGIRLGQLSSIDLLPWHVAMDLVQESLGLDDIIRLVGLALLSHFFRHAFHCLGLFSVMFG